MNKMPIAMSTTLATGAAASLYRTQERTQRGEEHEAGEDDDPEVHGVDNVATIKLDSRSLG